jgi:flagellar basal-body rod protein FlgB
MLNDTTMEVVRAALDGLAVRQQVTSHNMANAETPGFRASAVSFEQELQQALRPSRELHLVRTHAAHLTTNGQVGANLAPRVEQIANTGGRNDQNNVDVDREMIVLADTAIHYQALTRLLTRRFGMLRATIAEGRS